jgi:predicted PurR-regulated permease PerM
LLTFILAPVVSALEHLRLGRISAVVLATILATSILLAASWVVAWQMAALANELPQYRLNIIKKIDDLRAFKKGGALEKVEQTVEDVKSELNKTDEPADKPPPSRVVVAADEESSFWPIPLATGPMLERLAAAGLAVALVIFMLTQKEELRNRLIRILGYGRLTVTTRALEEAGHRISRYLLAQALINSAFGVAVGVVLSLVGVPYALLWGLLATLLRFVPYVGPWLAAFMPTALSLAYFPGWIIPLVVVGAFVLLELTTNLVLEPLFYGESAGVSEIAILIMAAFWTWLWGPVGLVLATPLTVCLVVFSKYVPEMTFITVLLSDAPALEPHVNYYQRMLALDQDEAEDIVEEYLKDHSTADLYEQVLAPALSRAKNDRRHGQITERDELAVYETTRTILEDMPEKLGATPEAAEAGRDENGSPPGVLPVLGFPADGKADELILLMFTQLLDRKRYRMEVASAEMLASEMVALVEEKKAPLVCLGAIAPGGVAKARYLSKRMRALSPDVKILVGRWGSADNYENARASLTAAGADRVAGSFLEARDQLVQLSHLEPAAPPVTRRAAG